MFFISKARRVFLYSKVYLPNLTWGFSKKNTAQNPNGSSSPNKKVIDLEYGGIVILY